MEDQTNKGSASGNKRRRASVETASGQGEDDPHHHHPHQHTNTTQYADYFLQASRYPSRPYAGIRYLNLVRNEDLHLSQEGKPTKDEGLMEESFCSNFVCCGIHLADLHALLQHYEDVHVKVQNVEDDGAGGIMEEDEECGELDVVGDSLPGTSSHSSSRNNGQGKMLAPPDTLGRQVKRTDSTLSTQSFGSTAAADALLGVATTYQPPYITRPRTADPYGYEYVQYPPYAYAPVPGYYSAMPRMHPGGEAPISAFDTTTILRTASPAYHNGGYPGASYYHPPQPFYAGGGHPMIPGLAPHYANMSHQLPNMAGGMSNGMVPGNQNAKGKSLKRPRSTSALHSMKAAQAASNTLRESLPASIADQEANPYKLIYSILSSTIDPASRNGANESMEDGNPAAAEALLAMDPSKGGTSAASVAARNAAAILSLPRPPVDKTLERPYICPVPGCGKSYKNPNGLKYHALHGHDGTNELVERPHKCPYGDCGKRYKNPNGLKYHVNKNHADMLPKSAVMAKAAQEASKAAAAAAAANDVSGVTYDDDSDAHDHD